MSANYDVSFLDGAESGRQVRGDVPVPLFVSVVFRNIMQVVSSDNDGPCHFGGNHDAPRIHNPLYLMILPLMLTLPVKGHFLSTKAPSMASLGVLNPRPTSFQ